MANETIGKDMIAKAAEAFIKDGATMKQLKGISNEELEAVYSLAFGYYRTGRFEDAFKLFQFLVLFDHLNAKYWFGLGAVQQATKDFGNAVVSYGYSSFLNLKNPKPQFHAAECFLALGDKTNALSSLAALDEFCPRDTDIGREYRAKAEALKKIVDAA